MSFGSPASRPRASATTAAAQTLAWAFAEKADFGMAPAMVASPITWMFGRSREFEGDGIDRAPAGAVGDAGGLGDARPPAAAG